MTKNYSSQIKKIEKYEHKMIITFCYLNPEGTVNHHEYARIFGIVRELFGLTYFPNFKKAIGAEYLLQTASASYEYRRNFRFGDVINVKMWVSEVGDTYFVLLAEFINEENGEVHAKGKQKIVYTDLRGRPQIIPEELRLLLQTAQY